MLPPLLAPLESFAVLVLMRIRMIVAQKRRHAIQLCRGPSRYGLRNHSTPYCNSQLCVASRSVACWFSSLSPGYPQIGGTAGRVSLKPVIANYGRLPAGARENKEHIVISGRITAKRKASGKLVFYDLTSDGVTIQVGGAYHCIRILGGSSPV